MANQTGTLNRHSTQFGSSKAHAGQVTVHHTSEGDRRNGNATARGCVSPLGGVSNHSTGDQSKKQEVSERPKMPATSHEWPWGR